MPARTEQPAGDVLTGIAASPGQVTATARVIAGPDEFDQMQQGDILVTRITTPAWTPLFALAAGVVTDVGGPLSHSSIVAREYHIPAVLGSFDPGIVWAEPAGSLVPGEFHGPQGVLENFVMKIDYASGDLIWILGDPTKYWHGFASLVAKSLTLPVGDLYPIGQHALSITHDGLLMLFNDGGNSSHQPAGAPAGEERPYSTVSAYSIDAAHGAAHESWRFDYQQTIDSRICSSAYEASSGNSVLADYAVADDGTQVRLVGLDASHNVVFDFQLANVPSGGCSTSWNAAPIPFEAMRFPQ